MARKNQLSDLISTSGSFTAIFRFVFLALVFAALTPGSKGDGPVKPIFCPALPRTLGLKPQCNINGLKGPCVEPQKVGTTATLFCAPFFRPINGGQGSEDAVPFITCQPNGTWSRDLNPVKDRLCTWDCGIGKASKTRGYAVGATVVTDQSRTQWPWHAALYESSGNKTPSVFCGGTLITPNVVLTAAHCVVEHGSGASLLKPDQIQVFFGKHESPYNKFDRNTQTIPIKLILKEETYVPMKYISDIALIILERPVNITNYVRPACLPVDQDLTETMLERAKPGGEVFGTTVGFGIDESAQTSQFLRRLDAPVVSPKECKGFLERELDKVYPILPSTICSGRPKDGAAVCRGDSGGGLVLPETNLKDNVTRYFVHGVVSHGPVKPNANPADFCHTWSYKVYTKVQFFSWWIRQVLKEHPVVWPGDEVMPSSTTLSPISTQAPIKVPERVNVVVGNVSESKMFLNLRQAPVSIKGPFACPLAASIVPCLCQLEEGGALKCEGKSVTSNIVETTLLKFMEVNNKMTREDPLSLQLLQISATDLTALNLTWLLTPKDKNIDLQIHNLTVSFNDKLEHLVPKNENAEVKLNVTHLHLEGNPRMTKDQGSLSAALISLVNPLTLRTLNLANNGLKTLSAPAFAPLLFKEQPDDPFQVTLNVMGNPLICNENLTWLGRNYNSTDLTAAVQLFNGEVPKCAGHPERTIFSFNFPPTVRGEPCLDACSQRGEKYYWCHAAKARKGWDYCSLPGMDRYGKECKEPCEFHAKPRTGQPYYFCTLESKWDYCSPDVTAN